MEVPQRQDRGTASQLELQQWHLQEQQEQLQVEAPQGQHSGRAGAVQLQRLAVPILVAVLSVGEASQQELQHDGASSARRRPTKGRVTARIRSAQDQAARRRTNPGKKEIEEAMAVLLQPLIQP